MEKDCEQTKVRMSAEVLIRSLVQRMTEMGAKEGGGRYFCTQGYAVDEAGAAFHLSDDAVLGLHFFVMRKPCLCLEVAVDLDHEYVGRPIFPLKMNEDGGLCVTRGGDGMEEVSLDELLSMVINLGKSHLEDNILTLEGCINENQKVLQELNQILEQRGN